MTPVVVEKSNVIKQFSYDPEKRILYIWFKTGKCFQYSEVSEEIYNQFKGADSKGKFFHSSIKGKFVHEQLLEGE